jgi:hypothetical protein
MIRYEIAVIIAWIGGFIYGQLPIRLWAVLVPIITVGLCTAFLFVPWPR